MLAVNFLFINYVLQLPDRYRKISAKNMQPLQYIFLGYIYMCMLRLDAVCEWCDCMHHIDGGRLEFTRHLYFHAFHKKLKTIGLSYIVKVYPLSLDYFLFILEIFLYLVFFFFFF